MDNVAVHPDELAALRTPDGEQALVAATALVDGAAGNDPLAAASALRATGVAAPLAAAALTQATLRRRAVVKFGPAAERMFFTRTGLEQATRAAVADRRAARLHAAGVRSLVDLGCGLGADALAAARAGIRVYAVEADPGTAALATANAAATGLAELVTVDCADATTVDVRGYDAAFCDPARRAGATGRRTFDPDSYSPPWSFIRSLVDQMPRTVLKVAPGIDHSLVPPGAQAEWVSVDREMVEATFWCGPLATTGDPPAMADGRSGDRAAGRQATLLRAGGPPAVLIGDGAEPVAVGPVRRYLYDPDGAVVRSHLVAAFAATVDGALADGSIAYVYADSATRTPYARCLEITDVLPFSLKRLRALVRDRGITRLEILKRGSALDPAQLRRDLRLRPAAGPRAGGSAASLVLTRVAGAPTALLARPVPAGHPSTG
ncbi:THUMP-like domain-containing protein [Solwaraspora sp. WMMB335]|uniref:THUMP-like domain-containing protein n=1 Tax=Solwaraspora sp. WMMB335 TaxID=3404118 RepID=UPI003B93CEE2